MKRCRFGLGLLLVLLVLGTVSAWAMGKGLAPMTEGIRQAGDAALQEDWDTAEALSAEVKAQWEKGFPYLASLSDHEPMENINGLFAQLEVYAQCRDPQNFAAVCGQLAQDLEAMGEAHSLKWWNIL